MVCTKSRWKDEADLKLGHHRDKTVEDFTCSRAAQIEEKQDGGK
jgi:hypothetical protein